MTITVYSTSRNCPTSLQILNYLADHGIDYEHYLPFPELQAHMQWAHGYDAFPFVYADEVFLGGAPEFWQMVEWRAVHGHAHDDPYDEWSTGR